MVYLEAAIQGLSLIWSFYFMYTWGIPVMELQVLRLPVLVELGSFVGVFKILCLFYYLLSERLFLD